MNVDGLIGNFDRALRAITGTVSARRPNPATQYADVALSDQERNHAAALMRVNHCGEVCAQGLYQGQALASDDDDLRGHLERAAQEEEDHLAWSLARIDELGGRASVLNPLWYVSSLAVGYAAGKLGDSWNLGFLRETERQVEEHLQRHLNQLNPHDERTRAIVFAMQRDEAGHARTAEMLGARDLPTPIRLAMKLSSRVMTSVTYYI